MNNSVYWNNRNQRAMKAVAHTQEMENNYGDQILYSINSTTEFFTDQLSEVPHRPAHKPDISISLVPKFTQDVIFDWAEISKYYNIAALNFASYKNPGGKFIEGSSAQEESLCHSSFLYNVLRTKYEYYNRNRMLYNNGFYKNRALYSPRIGFFREDGKECYINIITCAAPNKKAASRLEGYTEGANSMHLISRCQFVLGIAEYSNTDILILGAYGCGVFGQDAGEVAKIFKILLETYDYNFKQVVFAVPEDGAFNVNYKKFAEVFGVE